MKIKVWQVTLSMYRKYHKLRQQVGFIKGNLTRIIIYSRKCSFYILLIEVRNVGNNLISKSDRKPLPQAIAPHFPTFYSSASLTPNTNSLISKSDRRIFPQEP